MNSLNSHALLPSLITFSGPNGAGKSATARNLVDECSRIEIGKGVTTRLPRSKEQVLSTRHREYDYISEEEFATRSEQGEFAWEVVIGDVRYATPKWLFNRTDGKSTLLVIEPNTVGRARALCHGFAMSFYFFPPEEKELIWRMRDRGDSDDEIEKRLKQNRNREFWEASLCDQTIDWVTLKTDRNTAMTAARIKGIIFGG